MSALDDRRQSALEAGQDVEADDFCNPESGARAIEAAIETATRVDITDDMIEQARMNRFGQGHNVTPDDMRHILVDAFRAAGFEVER